MKFSPGRPGVVLGVVAVLVAVLPACSAPPGDLPAGETVLTDQLGRTVALNGVPQRIISLAPSNTEILFALGLADRIVGVTEYCDYPPEAADKPKVGGFSTVDIERVVAANPDLIVATSMHEAEVIPNLEKLGLATIALDPKDIDSVFGAISLVGAATGKEREASDLVAAMQERFQAVADRTDGLPAAQRARVLYVVRDDPLYVAGSGTLINELIGLAGGNNIFGDSEGYPTVSLETVVEADPQVIIAGTSMGSAQAAMSFLRSDDRLKNVSALVSGRLYEIDLNIVSRPGPRLTDGLEQFARMIQPGLFGQPG